MLMGPNGPCFELIYLVGMDYEDQISFRFTFVHKGHFDNYTRLHKGK